MSARNAHPRWWGGWCDICLYPARIGGCYGESMDRRPGFEIKDQAISFIRLVVHLGSAALLLVLGLGFRRLIDWALQDLPGSEYVERLLGGVTTIAIALVALGVIVTGLWVFVSDTYTDLIVRQRYNKALLEKAETHEDADAQ